MDSSSSSNSDCATLEQTEAMTGRKENEETKRHLAPPRVSRAPVFVSVYAGSKDARAGSLLSVCRRRSDIRRARSETVPGFTYLFLEEIFADIFTTEDISKDVFCREMGILKA